MQQTQTAHETWQWPETRAFLARLGVDLSLPIRRLEVKLETGGVPVVTVEHFGVDRPPAKLDEAALHRWAREPAGERPVRLER